MDSNKCRDKKKKSRGGRAKNIDKKRWNNILKKKAFKHITVDFFTPEGIPVTAPVDIGIDECCYQPLD